MSVPPLCPFSGPLPLSPPLCLCDLSLGQTNFLLPKLSILATNSAMVGGTAGERERGRRTLNCRLKLRGSFITVGGQSVGLLCSFLPLKTYSDPNLVINVRHGMGRCEVGAIDPREDGTDTKMESFSKFVKGGSEEKSTMVRTDVSEIRLDRPPPVILAFLLHEVRLTLQNRPSCGGVGEGR